jgi:hypothetical protein
MCRRNSSRLRKACKTAHDLKHKFRTGLAVSWCKVPAVLVDAQFDDGGSSAMLSAPIARAQFDDGGSSAMLSAPIARTLSQRQFCWGTRCTSVGHQRTRRDGTQRTTRCCNPYYRGAGSSYAQVLLSDRSTRFVSPSTPSMLYPIQYSHRLPGRSAVRRGARNAGYEG